MGISLTQYRASIGLFNRVHFTVTVTSVSFPFTILYIIIALLLLLLLYKCGDIELNPGPTNVLKLKSLNACHVNIRSLSSSKLRAIRTIFAELYDIITISETHLGPDSKTNLSLPGYCDILRRDRQAGGGGLAIYVKENIVFKRLYDVECNNIEVMWLQLNTIQGKVMLCNSYRPPDSYEFWDHFDRNIELVKESYDAKYMLIFGDLNADFATANGRQLNNLCSNHGLTCHIHEPTRITATTSSCLDQVISNMPNFITSTSVDPPISTNDHCTVTVNVNLKIAKQQPYERLIWKYSEGDYPGFRHGLANADWESCFEGDVDEVCTKWTEMFLNLARTYIPNKHVLIRPNDQPWYTNALRLLRRKVKRLFHKAKKLKSNEHWEKYKTERKNYQNKLDEAEIQHKQSLADSLTNSRNSKHWWGTVKAMMGKGGEDSYPAMKNEDDGSYVTDNQSKANLFNSFFLSHSKIDTSNAQLPVEDNPDQAFSLETIAVSDAEVADLLKCIDPNKATGPDGISPRLLKEGGDAIVPSLTRLFNLSLASAKVPKSWKNANVIPIFKKDDKSLTNNYRPISLLCVVSKIMEKIIFKHVYNFLHQHGLLSKLQSGFKPGDSTVNQLAALYHMFCLALDEKKDVRIVFCDISKAFDKVWHDGIIYKLQKMGIKGILLEWFKDYLKNRLQRVLIKGQASEWGEIKAGVPQGSVLGPLLFLIYINDIVNGIQSNIRLFADDTTLFISVEDPDNAALQMNNDMETIKSWADQWLVNFNPAKTKTMTFTNKTVQHPPLYFDNKELKSVVAHKHLGLTFTSSLSWSTHVNEIVQSSSKMCNVLKQFKYQIDRKSLETIYFSFIRPKLEYACQIWDDCTERDKESVENVQLNAARIVSGAKKGTSHVLLNEELQWQSLSERRFNIKLFHMHKIVNTNAPSYLTDTLPEKVNAKARYPLRNGSDFVQFNTRTEKFRKSFFPDCINMWNSLPEETRSITDLDAFKAKVVNTTSGNPLYYYGCRKANIIHSQLRMQCSNLKAHLVDLHVIDDPLCLCGISNEDNQHFFFECPLYYTHRLKLINAVNQISILTLENLLYGDSNLDFDHNCLLFKAVHDYILESERF